MFHFATDKQTLNTIRSTDRSREQTLCVLKSFTLVRTVAAVGLLTEAKTFSTSIFDSSQHLAVCGPWSVALFYLVLCERLTLEGREVMREGTWSKAHHAGWGSVVVLCSPDIFFLVFTLSSIIWYFFISNGFIVLPNMTQHCSLSEAPPTYH